MSAKMNLEWSKMASDAKIFNLKLKFPLHDGAYIS